jgi:hypothetical protein
MPHNRPEIERLEETPRMGEPHDGDEGDERYDEPDEGGDRDTGEGGGDG